MPRSHIKHWLAVAAVAALALRAYPARAHAILLDGSPPVAGTVAAGAVEVELRFNSRIDHDRSRLRLVAADRTVTVLALTPDAPPEMLRAAITLAPGAYTLRWQVLAVDGHITRGDVPFIAAGK